MTVTEHILHCAHSLSGRVSNTDMGSLVLVQCVAEGNKLCLRKTTCQPTKMVLGAGVFHKYNCSEFEYLNLDVCGLLNIDSCSSCEVGLQSRFDYTCTLYIK